MVRVLLVDDDPLLRATLCAWLETDGHQVVIADGGASGLIALRNEAFDLMIVDIFMPHMRGLDSIRVFHQHAPATPLIAISGYVFAENKVPAPDFLRMALELGASECLRKPFTPMALLALVRSMLVAGPSTIVAPHSAVAQQT